MTATWSFLEHSGGSRGSRGSRRSRWSGGKKCGSEPQSTRTGGQDDGSYTNSLKLDIEHHFWIICGSPFYFPIGRCSGFGTPTQPAQPAQPASQPASKPARQQLADGRGGGAGGRGQDCWIFGGIFQNLKLRRGPPLPPIPLRAAPHPILYARKPRAPPPEPPRPQHRSFSFFTGVLGPGRYLEWFVWHFSSRYIPSDPRSLILDPKLNDFRKKSRTS